MRPYNSGAIYHLTARLQFREALLDDELKTRVVSFLRDHVTTRDFDVFAYAIMTNHLHLVIRQHGSPLSALMQPLLRRAALLIQRRYGRCGHVFEQRFRHRICADPDYLRNAIVYTHLNPVRAALCEHVDRYAWTSHAAWIGRSDAPDGRVEPLDVDTALPLFASGPDRTRAELITDYLSFLDWRVRIDDWWSNTNRESASGCSPPPPSVIQGNAHWKQYLAPMDQRYANPYVSGEIIGTTVGTIRPDIAAIARSVIAASSDPLDAEIVRSRWGGRRYAEARRTITRRAFLYGYRSVQIAAYLRVSPSSIAAVRAADRKMLLKAKRQAA